MIFGCLSIFALVVVLANPAAAASVSRHEIGPWPVVSKLIGYRDDIWFANSVKGANHNSADLWSVSVLGGEPTYEGHLFSQDAGDPVVHRGLLYWPLEDARAEPGIGAFDVTDGERWEHGLIPNVQAFHVHTMTATSNYLYATPSAWKASVTRSEDGGGSWTEIYRHPTPDRRVSRITELAVLGDRVVGTLNAPEGRRLIRVDDGSGEPVAGWPTDRRFADLVSHQGDLYGLISDQGGSGIWQCDGDRSSRIWTTPGGWVPLALTGDDEALWMVGQGERAAELWTSPDARDWTYVAELEGGRPSSITTYRGVVAVGGSRDRDRGVLWVVRSGPPANGKEVEPSWPSFDQGPSGTDFDWPAAAGRIDRMLSNPDGYGRYGVRLGKAIMELPKTDIPDAFYNDRLRVDMPDDPFPMFADIVLPEAAMIGRWYLYWGMGLSRTGRVDPMDILRPRDYAANGPAKHFSSAEIAMWAAGRIGRPDPGVLEALIRRIEDEKTPLWLKGDAIGALRAITGQRLDYDTNAWRAWLDRQT